MTDPLDLSKALPPGCLYARGRFAPADEFLPYPAPVQPLAFGWTQLSKGGDRIEWAESADGPWVQGRSEPDWGHQRILDRIEPRRLCTLGADGSKLCQNPYNDKPARRT